MLKGTLPGRKPDIFAVRAIFLRRELISDSIEVAGKDNIKLRSRLLAVEVWACMVFPDIKRQYAKPSG
jgi:hypothetical protein